MSWVYDDMESLNNELARQRQDRIKEVDSILEEFWGEIDFTIYPDWEEER